jgi:hypothetical protein
VDVGQQSLIHAWQRRCTLKHIIISADLSKE